MTSRNVGQSGSISATTSPRRRTRAWDHDRRVGLLLLLPLVLLVGGLTAYPIYNVIRASLFAQGLYSPAAGIFLWQNCGDFFNSRLEVTVDNIRTHEALRFYADLLKYAPPDAGAWGFTEPIESFWSGRAAMVYYWHGLDLTFRQNPALIDNIGVVPLPKGRIRATEQGGRYISVFAASPAVELSKQWVEHMFSIEQARELTEIQPMLYPPDTRQALADLRNSPAPTIRTYGDQLFNVVYTSSEFAYNQIFNGGGVNPETCAIEATGVLNPYVSILWNSNLYARAVQRVAYENWEPSRAAAAAQTALARQVETARREFGGTTQ